MIEGPFQFICTSLSILHLLCHYERRPELGRFFNPSLDRLRGFLLRLLLSIQRLVQTKAGAGAVCSNAAVGINLGDKLLAAGVDKESDKIRAHVVTGEVSEDLGKVSLVQVDVDEQKTVEVLLGLDNEAAVRSVDTGVAVVDRRIGLGLDTLGSVDLQTLDGETLERSKSPCSGLDGVLRSDQVRGRISVVGGRVRVNLALLAGVDRPGGNVNLLSSRDVKALEERVHVLPAVKLTDAANAGLADRLEGVTGAVTVDKLLDVSGLDLASVVNDVAIRGDEDLREVKSGVVDLRETKRDVDLVVTCSSADTAHLLGVDSHGVLTVTLQHGERLHVGDLPHPVGVARDPYEVLDVYVRGVRWETYKLRGRQPACSRPVQPR